MRIALALLPFLSLWTAAAPSHPLDPLEEGEITRAVDVLRQEKKAGDGTLFPLLTLQEPTKAEVLGFKPGQRIKRKAFAVLYDRPRAKAFEAVVDLDAAKLLSFKERPGIHPPVMLSEFNEFPALVKAEPEFVNAMNRRGIKNLDEVAVDIWAFGTPEGPAKNRLLRAIPYYMGKGKNFYARPIEGVTAVIDASNNKVEKVVDSGALPLPPVASELDAQSLAPQRPALKSLEIRQEQGPSFVAKGWQVSWDGWTFHFSMHPREGLVLHQAAFRGRSVLYRGSLSEMMVPYGHPDAGWTWRSAFDEGEYGIGRYSGSLARGTDVPGNASLYDAVFADDKGKAYTVKDAVAVYERDGGLLWKHFDMYNGGNYSRRARDLVVSFVTTISNYDYGLNWVFHQDGTLELEAQLTGIMLAKGSPLKAMDHGSKSDDMKFAHLVAPYVAAPHHQHFFNFRLDLDVDGASKNRVVEMEARPIPPGPGNPAGNAFAMTEETLSTEKQARRDLNMMLQRKWKVENTGKMTSLGYHPGYLLSVGENSVPMLAGTSPLRTRGGFVEHAFWATQFAQDEVYAAGDYPNQRNTADGLPVWSEKDRLLEDQDVVVWYTFGITHAPRPEEWPVMPLHRAGFKLMPVGFFDKNPALDVP
jgi:primary-amine oxidase